MPGLEDYKSSAFFAEKAKKAHIKSQPKKVIGKKVFDIIDSGEEFPEKGILFHLIFIRGKMHGVGRIILFEKLEKINVAENKERVDLLLKGKNLYFGMEDPNYAFRLAEPFNRNEPESHIPFTAGLLKVMDTLQNGRIFIQDLPNDAVHHFRINNHIRGLAHAEEISIYFEGNRLEDLKSILLKTINDDAGLLKSDAEFITDQLIKRLSK